MKIDDDNHILKLKSLSFSDERIAKKLGMTPEQVAERWKQIQEEMARMQENGYSDLCNCFTIMCQQYQLLGGSLRILATILDHRVPESELEMTFTPDRLKESDAKIAFSPEQKAWLMSKLRKFIVLHPVAPMTAEEMVKTVLKGN
jgi:hypothetical protein